MIEPPLVTVGDIEYWNPILVLRMHLKHLSTLLTENSRQLLNSLLNCYLHICFSTSLRLSTAFFAIGHLFIYLHLIKKSHNDQTPDLFAYLRAVNCGKVTRVLQLVC